jgi:CubicO group peptidase (beta-lactamase class C family)
VVRLEPNRVGGLAAVVVALMSAVALASCAIQVHRPEAPSSLAQANLVDPSRIEAAHRFLSERTEFDAFAAMRGEELITTWGDVDLPINTHSVRKSLLSALFGIAAAKGLVDLDATLGSLGIDEPGSPLTAAEKGATVRQLLQSRSGVYIEAAGETQAMRDGRPRRGQYAPGEFFYYNNWDFNVLGAVFEQRAKMSLGQAFEQWIAQPIAMRSFRADHVTYTPGRDSQYRQFVIYMSAADLARFGVLFVQQGRWAGRQVIPSAWVDDSLTARSAVDGVNGPKTFDGYGLLWWIDSRSATAWADGWRGQYLIVDRARKLVVVSRNDTGRNLISSGWAVLFGRDGFRDHHQQLHRLMAEATGRSHVPAP